MMNTIVFFIISLIGYLVWQITKITTQMKATPVYLRIRRRNDDG
jgi:hypothetical protein